MRLLQHYFNSMHVFCRLTDLGMSRKRALRFCRAWERCAHPLVYAFCRKKG